MGRKLGYSSCMKCANISSLTPTYLLHGHYSSVHRQTGCTDCCFEVCRHSIRLIILRVQMSVYMLSIGERIHTILWSEAFLMSCVIWFLYGVLFVLEWQKLWESALCKREELNYDSFISDALAPIVCDARLWWGPLKISRGLTVFFCDAFLTGLSLSRFFTLLASLSLFKPLAPEMTT